MFVINNSRRNHTLLTQDERNAYRLLVQHRFITYRSIARQYFPNATIVADRFHVVRLVNQHFLKPWQLHDPEGRKNRGLLSLMRRHQWRLSDEQRINLDHYLEKFPVLKAMYQVKQKLNQFLLLKTPSNSGPTQSPRDSGL